MNKFLFKDMVQTFLIKNVAPRGIVKRPLMTLYAGTAINLTISYSLL